METKEYPCRGDFANNREKIMKLQNSNFGIAACALIPGTSVHATSEEELVFILVKEVDEKAINDKIEKL
jgi:hypothetical protein